MKITEKSRLLVEEISHKIPTFHHHYHILYDITNEFKNVNYVEIGAYAGASATLMLLNDNVKKVTSIDLGQPISMETTLNNISSYIDGDRCTDYKYIKGSSFNKETYDKLVNILNGEKVDILFIDGDHTYNGVKTDFELYNQLVGNGGYIVFDDYHCEHSIGVKRYVDDLVKTESFNNEFDIIGCLSNDFGAKPKTLKVSNEYIVKKK